MKSRSALVAVGKLLAILWKKVPLYACAGLLDRLLRAAKNVLVNSLAVLWLQEALASPAPYPRVIWILLAVGAAAAAACLTRSLVQDALRPRAQLKLKKAMQAPLQDKAAALPLQAMDEPQTYNRAVLAAAQADERALLCLDSALDCLEASLSLAGFLGVMTALDPWLLLPAGLYAAVSYGVNLRRAALSADKERQLQDCRRRRDYVFRLHSLPAFAKELRLSRVDGPLFARFREALREAERIHGERGRRLTHLALLRQLLCEALLLNVGVYASLTWRLLVRKDISVGVFLSLGFAAENLVALADSLADQLGALAEHGLFAENYFDFLRLRTEPKGGELRPEGFESLELRGLRFAYPGGEELLHGVDLCLRRGEKLALVGENGSGKSTLVKLLLGLYAPTGGSVLLNGRPLEQYELAAVRGLFSVVQQDFQLYALSVLENVAMRPDGDEAVARRALDELRLGGLPLRAPLLRELEERGVELSGGQAQRLALARGLYPDRPVWVLDEPSAALDARSERELNRLMAGLAGEKTLLLITHRLSATARMDRICVLGEGCVLESGSHEELLRKDGAYARLWRAQAKPYTLE